MDEFPEDFTLQKCMRIIETNQAKWTKEVRKDFHEKIMAAVENCDRKVSLDFPQNLWPEHKTQITKELLTIFGELQIKTNQQSSNATVTKLISDGAEISKEPNTIVIQFHK